MARDSLEDFERRLLAVVRDHFEWVDGEYPDGYEVGDFVLTWEGYKAPNPNKTLKAWYGGPYPGWMPGNTTLGSSTSYLVDKRLLEVALAHVNDYLDELDTGAREIGEAPESDEASQPDDSSA
jgi:hypothetical protein